MSHYHETIRKRLNQLAFVLQQKIYSEKRGLEPDFQEARAPRSKNNLKENSFIDLKVSTATGRINYTKAQRLQYRQAKLGEQFGPLWSTFWFKASATIPRHWAGKRVDLIWIAHNCESTLWMNGRPLEALNYSLGERKEAVLLDAAKPEQKVEFEIEMACNTVYGEFLLERPYQSLSPYVLDVCELGVFNPKAWKLYMDFSILQQLEAEMNQEESYDPEAYRREAHEPRLAKKNQSWNQQLLSELNRFANRYDPNNEATWPESQSILSSLLSKRNVVPAHQISAVGEAHLDLAWWWPVAETRRKIVRTAATQIRLMDRYPNYRFVCSQAWVHQELKALMPELYKRAKDKIKRGQWIPVGGTWVESDLNLPSGESLVRQFLFGQRFFETEFGYRIREGWFQDSFGFNAQLPQIMRLAGITRFVTQKLLWAQPKPRHRLFNWCGIDGKSVLTHIDFEKTFSNDLKIKALKEEARLYGKDNFGNHSLISYGWGDGGGGPTPRMIEILNRLKDLQGAPQVAMCSPSEFFSKIEKGFANQIGKLSLPSQEGELYFPYHRGTYTTCGAIKKAMTDAQSALHNVEFLCSMAFKLYDFEYPQETINNLWKIVLFNQFHDILPGVSIKMVEDQALEELQKVIADCQQIESTYLAKFFRRPKQSKRVTKKKMASRMVPINTLGFERRELVPDSQNGVGEDKYIWIEAPSYGVGRISKPTLSNVSLLDRGGVIKMENEKLIATFGPKGHLIKLYSKEADREALAAPGNRLQIYEDNPLAYDAWELEAFHMQTEKECLAAHTYKTHAAPLAAEIVFERKLNAKSSMTQTVRLLAGSGRLEFHCDVDWQEEHKFLKVLFPMTVHSDTATYGIQFGALERPTHYNTVYDQAKFEVAALRWADLSEQKFGVSLLTDCKYGFSVYKNEMRVSLLKAPTSPDPQCDRGKHKFMYAIFPHVGTWQQSEIVSEAAKLIHPVLWGESSDSEVASFASVDDPNLVIDTIKKAEDSKALVLRLYECHGAHGTANLQLGFPVSEARFANILEDAIKPASVENNRVQIAYKPFEIITLMID